MRLIIAGSRHITGERAQQLVREAIDASGWKDQITEIIQGGVNGIDAAASEVCKERWPLTVFLADWPRHGGRRLQLTVTRPMADCADALIAVWDGRSRGTRNMISTATTLGLRVFVHRVE